MMHTNIVYTYVFDMYVAKGKVKTPGSFQYNLYEELKKYLKKEKTLIGADQSMFQIIFSTFQNYEVSILSIHMQ